jgi:hypothetical protein
VQGAELGDDGELVFFLGESDQRTSEDPVIVQYHLERAPVNLMRPAGEDPGVCRSGFTTLSAEPLPKRPVVVLLRGRHLALLVIRSG